MLKYPSHSQQAVRAQREVKEASLEAARVPVDEVGARGGGGVMQEADGVGRAGVGR